MFDDVHVYSVLDSSLHGAMFHVLGAVAPLVKPDCAAVRVFNGGAGSDVCCVDACRLNAPHDVENRLRDWPREDGSLFHIVSDLAMRDHVFTFSDIFGNGQTPPDSAFGLIGKHRPVVDALCATFPVTGSTWAMIAFLRCRDNKPFQQEEIDNIKTLRLSLARVLTAGLRQHAHGGKSGKLLAAPPAAAHLIAELTATERQILDFLRTDITEREIAQRIHRSLHTVHSHVKSVYRKLNVNSRRQLKKLFEPEGWPG